MKTLFIKYGLFFLFACGIWSCNDYKIKDIPKNIYVDHKAVSIFVGEQVQLTASPSDGTYSYEWISEDSDIAKVTSSGLVEALSEGNTFITVRSGDVKTSVPLTSVVRIPVQDIKFSEPLLDLVPGDQKTLAVTFLPENTNDIPPHTWSSEDTDVARVDDSGIIMAISEGTTNIVYKIGDIERKVPIEVSYTRPFNGPHIASSASPLFILAADFDFGGLGYAFNHDANNRVGNDNYRRGKGDTNSANVEIEGNGTNIGYVSNGEWYQYTVDFVEEGVYLVELSLSAAAANGSLRLEIDGENTTGSISIPNNGSWSAWTYRPTPPLEIHFTKGKHKIKLVVEQATYNLRGLRFTKK